MTSNYMITVPSTDVEGLGNDTRPNTLDNAVVHSLTAAVLPVDIPLTTFLLSTVAVGHVVTTNVVVPPVVSNTVFTESTTATMPGGETVTFSVPVLVTYDVNGWPGVRSDRAFSITEWTPATAVDDNGYIYNGAMDTPQLIDERTDGPDPRAQGFDASFADEAPVGGKTTQKYPFGDNISFPYAIALGKTGTIVKSVRDPALPNTSGILKYMQLTIFDGTQKVPANYFAPAFNDPNAQVILHEALLVNTPYISDTRFDSIVTRQEALDLVSPLCFMAASYESDNFRRMMTTEQEGYGSKWGINTSKAMMYLHSSASDADKKELYYRILSHGISVVGLMRNENYLGKAAAGQFGGTWPALALLTMSMGDNTFIDDGYAWRSNTNRQIRFIDTIDIGYPSAWPYGSRRNQTTSVPAQLNEVQWFFTDVATKVDKSRTGTIEMRYSGATLACRIWESLSVAVMQGGPNGMSGVDFILENEPIDNTNKNAAIIWVNDLSAWSDFYYGKNLFDAEGAKEAYRGARDLINYPAHPNTPWPTFKDFPTGGDGEIVCDLSDVLPLALTYMEPVLEMQVRASNDGGVSGRTVDVPLNGTGVVSIPVPAGEYRVQMRSRNVNGWGLWSYNHPKDLGENPRNIVTVTDTANDRAPTVTNGEGIFRKPYIHPTNYFEVVPTIAPDDVFKYIASAGVVDMKPVRPPTITWFADGIAIAGETRAELDNDISEYSGATLTCQFTYSNGVGSDLTFTVGPVTGGSGSYGIFYPQKTDELASLPDNLTLQWDRGSNAAIVLDTNAIPMAFTGSSKTEPHFWSIDKLGITGVTGASLPEGQTVFRTARYSSGSTRFAGLIIRASGDETTADGVTVAVAAGANDFVVEIARVEGGAEDSATQYLFSGNGFKYPNENVRDSFLPINVRIDWREESGNLVVRVKAWRTEDLEDEDGVILFDGVDEPEDWDVEHTVTGIPTGEMIGFGASQSMNRRVGPLTFTETGKAPLVI